MPSITSEYNLYVGRWMANTRLDDSSNYWQDKYRSMVYTATIFNNAISAGFIRDAEEERAGIVVPVDGGVKEGLPGKYET